MPSSGDKKKVVTHSLNCTSSHIIRSCSLYGFSCDGDEMLPSAGKQHRIVTAAFCVSVSFFVRRYINTSRSTGAP